MKQRNYNENTGISYTLEGNYYLRVLALPEKEDKPNGLWGQRHLRYIKQHKNILYINLLTSGKLNDHRADIDKQAENMFSRLVKQIAECEGINEQHKANNQMEWVAQMNSIRSRATEVVNHDMIYN